MNIKEAIKWYFVKQRDVVCVYLFGSSASEKENRFSDVDIAVLFDDRIPREKYSRRILSFMDEMSAILDRDMDVIALNSANSFLKFQIIKNGIPAYEHPDRIGRDFEARAVIEYFDFFPVRERLEKALINGIREA